ncbi:GFA family protein [Sphingomonas aerophila]|uniref:GFA family protein n=1 Tax=Sphingomonas aerophila TaxID=1344948 RepID=UPI00160ECCFC
MTVRGKCRCGACSYHIAIDALPRVYACHCHVCQRWTGSAFSVQALVPEDRLVVTGPISIQEVITEDRTSTQRFCSTCYGRIYNTNTRRPGVAVVRAGTFDRSEELDCVAHIFTAYRQRWVVIPANVASWPEAAPPDDFVRALTV